MIRPASKLVLKINLISKLAISCRLLINPNLLLIWLTLISKIQMTFTLQIHSTERLKSHHWFLLCWIQNWSTTILRTIEPELAILVSELVRWAKQNNLHREADRSYQNNTALAWRPTFPNYQTKMTSLLTTKLTREQHLGPTVD